MLWMHAVRGMGCWEGVRKRQLALHCGHFLNQLELHPGHFLDRQHRLVMYWSLKLINQLLQSRLNCITRHRRLPQSHYHQGSIKTASLETLNIPWHAKIRRSHPTSPRLPLQFLLTRLASCNSLQQRLITADINGPTIIQIVQFTT